MSRLGLWMVVLAACDGGGSGADDTDTVVSEPAPLVEPSGACPDFSESGAKTMTSNGQDRSFDIYFPKDKPAGMPVVFIWHGLGPESPDPVDIFVQGFDLEALARSKDAVVVVPRALPFNLAGFPVLLWGILGNEEDDLAFYDDLRTCVVRDLGADVRRVSSWGFSGGGLWSSFLTIHRADTLATVAVASGGSDINILAAEHLAYETPAARIPVLLASGGANDRWPDPALTIIDFEEATDNLQSGLRGDGEYVARCHHDTGHNVPEWVWTQTKKWLFNHTYGEPSPYEDGTESLDEGCASAE